MASEISVHGLGHVLGQNMMEGTCDERRNYSPHSGQEAQRVRKGAGTRHTHTHQGPAISDLFPPANYLPPPTV
jgi:hypothetical protein